MSVGATTPHYDAALTTRRRDAGAHGGLVSLMVREAKEAATVEAAVEAAVASAAEAVAEAAVAVKVLSAPEDRENDNLSLESCAELSRSFTLALRFRV